MEDQLNPVFVGNMEKFKMLAIHGYEKFQADKDGKLHDGSRLWIRDACRKDSDADYSRLTCIQRYTLDGLRRLTGLHGKWCPNDPMWVARALCVNQVERKYVTHAVKVLVRCGLVALSNESLGSLEGREGRERRGASLSSPDWADNVKPESTTTAPNDPLRELREWNEPLGIYSAEQIRKAIVFQLDVKKDKWYKPRLSVNFVRKQFQKLMNDTPPSALVAEKPRTRSRWTYERDINEELDRRVRATACDSPDCEGSCDGCRERRKQLRAEMMAETSNCRD